MSTERRRSLRSYKKKGGKKGGRKGGRKGGGKDDKGDGLDGIRNTFKKARRKMVVCMCGFQMHHIRKDFGKEYRCIKCRINGEYGLITGLVIGCEALPQCRQDGMYFCIPCFARFRSNVKD